MKVITNLRVKKDSKNVKVIETLTRDEKTGYRIRYENGDNPNNGEYFAIISGEHYILTCKFENEDLE